jgi:hypothetical protein
MKTRSQKKEGKEKGNSRYISSQMIKLFISFSNEGKKERKRKKAECRRGKK